MIAGRLVDFVANLLFSNLHIDLVVSNLVVFRCSDLGGTRHLRCSDSLASLTCSQTTRTQDWFLTAGSSCLGLVRNDWTRNYRGLLLASFGSRFVEQVLSQIDWLLWEHSQFPRGLVDLFSSSDVFFAFEGRRSFFCVLVWVRACDVVQWMTCDVNLSLGRAFDDCLRQIKSLRLLDGGKLLFFDVGRFLPIFLGGRRYFYLLRLWHIVWLIRLIISFWRV